MIPFAIAFNAVVLAYNTGQYFYGTLPNPPAQILTWMAMGVVSLGVAVLIARSEV